MKAWKKIMAGTLVGAMSAGMLAAAPVNAEVAVSGNKTITGMQSGKESYVSFDYIKESKSKGAYVNAKAKWDVYDGQIADLSNLKTTKKQYVTVDDSGKKTTFVFAENKDKYSGKCDGKTITFKKGKTEIAAADVMTKDSKAVFEYRTEAASSWTDYKTGTGSDVFSLAPYEQQGATLYFRTKAVVTNNNASVAASPLPVDGIDSKASDYGQKYAFASVAANALPGKEFKVKIPKKSNGPSIKVDYNKNTIKEVRNGQMRAAVDSAVDNIVSATFEPAKDYVIADSSKKGIFEAKTVKSGKPDSKISIYKWDAVPTPDIKVAASSTFGPNATLTPELAVTKLDAASRTKSISLKNNSEKKTYLVYVGDTAPKVGDRAVATIKPGKEVKLVESKVAQGAKLWIGCAGDKKTNTLASVILQSGTVYYPTPSPAATAGN